MMISFPPVSFDYTLIFLLIPIIEFIKEEKTSKKENIIYSILFGLLLIPINFYEKHYLHKYIDQAINDLGETVYYIIDYPLNISISLLIKPLIIIAIILIIIMFNIKNKKVINHEKKERITRPI